MLVPILHGIHRLYVSLLNIAELSMQILVVLLELLQQIPTTTELVLSFITLNYHLGINFLYLTQLLQYVRLETAQKGVINRRKLEFIRCSMICGPRFALFFAKLLHLFVVNALKLVKVLSLFMNSVQELVGIRY